jgi:tRNA modification GTPase
MFATEDTIVAISTAAGNSPRAIVRLSGPEAVKLAAETFVSHEENPEALSGFSARDGLVRLGDYLELPARAYVFRAPRSYTRQDVVELHVPGAIAAAKLLGAFLDAGARQAQPGEFTARAFFSGRLDLSAAEAVADIIHAADDSQLREAITCLGGHLHAFCRNVSEDAAEILATVEASIDLADEEIQLERPSVLARRLTSAAEKIDAFLAGAGDMDDRAEEPRAALAGRPNVGKSSLLNALCETDRAIVSSMAGTTRDVLGATISLDGASAILQDAAGFGNETDSLSSAAANAARRAIAGADAVLFVFDASDANLAPHIALLAEVRAANANAPLLLLANKADLPGDTELARRLEQIAAAAGRAPLPVSAVTGKNLSRLRSDLRDALHLRASRSGDAIALHQRQKRCLAACGESLRAAEKLLSGAPDVADAAELTAVELRSALTQLGQISGQVVTEDILGRIFRRFCVGK